MFNRKILNDLKKWKRSIDRKPLIIRGARQVGKTSAVLMFAKQNYSNVIYINLEKAEHARLFRAQISLDEFLNIIQIKFKTEITKNTLIFIDEIQNNPSLISLLRFFYEERKDISVIAAGSLLEVKIQKEGLEMPVGRVQYMYMYPLDFFEFLEAIGDINLIKFLKTIDINSKIPTSIHIEALSKFKQYVLIGGMPEVVAKYIKVKNYYELQTIYSSLFTSYMEDVYKYSSHAEAKYLSFIIDNAPLFAGTTITYNKFAGSNYSSREISRAFETLNKTMLVNSVKGTISCKLPLIPKNKKPSKLIFLDTGLVNARLGMIEQFLNTDKIDNFYQGRIAEQVVGQHLLSFDLNQPLNIYYWSREKPLGSAEVDFSFVYKGKIIGIEVKSGSSGKLRSLVQFSKLVNPSVIIKISSQPFGQEKISIANEQYPLLSVPFYLLPRLLSLLPAISR